MKKKCIECGQEVDIEPSEVNIDLSQKEPLEIFCEECKKTDD